VIITLLADSVGRRLPRIGDPVPGDYDISEYSRLSVHWH
jgi:hypothetical protein